MITNTNITKINIVKPTSCSYHVFNKLGEFFVFDTTSCNFYKIDNITYHFLKLCFEMSIDDAEAKLIASGQFTKNALASVANEIRILAENGLFDTPDYSMSSEQLQESLDSAYKTPIMGLELALAESCNLACKYCYCGTSRNMPNNGLMTEEIAKKAVLWLFEVAKNAKSPKVNITLFGGEPLLNKPVIYAIIDYSQKLSKEYAKKVAYCMTTNATLLDDAFLEYAKKYHINIMVSLDGPKSIHDAQCPMHNGSGSFDLAAAGAKRLLKQSRATVRCTMAHPAPKLKELIDFFENFGFSRAIIGPTINPAFSPSSVDFTDADFLELARQEEDLIPWILEKSLKKEKLQYSPFHKFLARIQNCKPKTDVKKCGACHGCTFVGADGSLFPCHRFGGMKEWQIGHISVPPDYEKFKIFWAKYRNSLKNCESCWAWAICKGPCPWEIMKNDGTFNVNSRFCNFLKKRIEGAAYIYAWLEEHNCLADTKAKLNKNYPETNLSVNQSDNIQKHIQQRGL